MRHSFCIRSPGRRNKLSRHRTTCPGNEQYLLSPVDSSELSHCVNRFRHRYHSFLRSGVRISSSTLCVTCDSSVHGAWTARFSQPASSRQSVTSLKIRRRRGASKTAFRRRASERGMDRTLFSARSVFNLWLAFNAEDDAERRRRHSDAEHRNEGRQSVAVILRRVAKVHPPDSPDAGLSRVCPALPLDQPHLRHLASASVAAAIGFGGPGQCQLAVARCCERQVKLERRHVPRL